LANALERRLHDEGIFTQLLDGDNLRSGLNSDLGFSDEDRCENIRRVAEVAKLFASAGVVTIAAVICPRAELRTLAWDIVGEQDFFEVYVECSFETCEARDVKGLYAKAKAGRVEQFTGRDSAFEPGVSPDLTLNTDDLSEADAAQQLFDAVRPRVNLAE
jgi:adenylylsulfate kinase